MTFSRTQPDATWNNGGAGGYYTLASDWKSLGTKAADAINGDDGGSWAPSSPIQITGSLKVTGPTIVDYNGSIVLSSGASFGLFNTDNPKLGANHVGRTRTLLAKMFDYVNSPNYTFGDALGYPGSLQSMAGTIFMPSNPAKTFENCGVLIPLRVHDGGRLVSGVITFRVTNPHDQNPTAMPRMRIIRTDMSGTILSLMAPSLTVDADGYTYFPKPGAGVLWYANGLPQTWAFTCNQNNVIDTSQYLYFVQLFDEVGTVDNNFSTSDADGSSIRNRYPDVVFTYTYTPYLTASGGGPGVVGPYGDPAGDINVAPRPAISDGDYVLFAKPLTGAGLSDYDRSINGIWQVHTSGAWGRIGTLSSASDCTPYGIVFDKFASQFYEFSGPFYGSGRSINLPQTAFTGISPGQMASGSVGNYNLTGTVLNFQPRRLRGNVYHSISCTFDSIADMRPQ